MSTRERWIVYPLLFLTLGIAMRNQFLPTRTLGAVDLRAGDLTAHKIVCDQLVVQQSEECNTLQFQDLRGKRIGANYLECLQSKTGEGDFGKIAVSDKQGKPVILMLEDERAKSGVIQTMRADGVPQVQIHSNDDAGGIVTAIGQSGQVFVALGHEGKAFGVFAQRPQFGPPVLLTPLLPFHNQLIPPKTIPNQAPDSSPEEKPEAPKQEQ